MIRKMNATTTASARLHLDTALALVGRDQIMAWLSDPIPSGTSAAAPPLTTTIRRTIAATVAASTSATSGQRGRKVGTLPPVDQRCSWMLNNGEQCSNKKKDGSFCGLHVGKIHLVDPTASVPCGPVDE